MACTYPDCNCPFDHPGTPGWCARGLPTQPQGTRMNTPTPTNPTEAARLIEAVRNSIDAHRKELPDEWHDWVAEQVRDLNHALKSLRAAPSADVQGVAVAWEVIVTGVSGKTYRAFYEREPDPDAFGSVPVIRPLYATPPQPAGAVDDELVAEGLDYFEHAGDEGDRKYVYAIRQHIAALEAARIGGGDAHWAFAAAAALRPFVDELMDVGPTSATDRGHLLWMIERMNPKSMSATKACRWLGWIQSALCDQGVMNLPAAKEHNLRFSTTTPQEPTR